MDNLTHGLFGLAVGALRRQERGGPGRALSQTDRAVPWACLVAAQLPDLDTLWPAQNAILQALHAHRGPSHSLLAAPLVAAVAVGLVRLYYRRARPGPMFAFALPSVLFAHLLADAWTGWGTRLFLPFSDARLSLDWALVVDPFITLPLLVGAGFALLRPFRWRKAMLLGAAVAVGYLGLRVGARAHLLHQVRTMVPQAQRVEVFPTPLNPWRWRYAAVTGEAYRVGTLSPSSAPLEQARWPRQPSSLPQEVASNQTVAEALAWARLPLVEHSVDGRGIHRVRVADLRYHLGGAPTLAFLFELDAAGALTASSFDRGGSAVDLVRRWRGREAAAPSEAIGQ